MGHADVCMWQAYVCLGFQSYVDEFKRLLESINTNKYWLHWHEIWYEHLRTKMKKILQRFHNVYFHSWLHNKDISVFIFYKKKYLNEFLPFSQNVRYTVHFNPDIFLDKHHCLSFAILTIICRLLQFLLRTISSTSILSLMSM